jgi:hypothetical protein
VISRLLNLLCSMASMFFKFECRALVAALFIVTLIASGGGGGATTGGGPVVVNPPVDPLDPSEPTPDSDVIVSVATLGIDSLSLENALGLGLQHVFPVSPVGGDIKLAVRTSANSAAPIVPTVYEGTAVAQVTDGTATYAVTMDARTTLRFVGGAGRADVLADNVRTGGTTIGQSGVANYNPTGAEMIEITDIEFSGPTLLNGMQTDASAIGFGTLGAGNILEDSTQIPVTAVLAGPIADEIAGVGGASGPLGEVLITWSGAQSD